MSEKAMESTHWIWEKQQVIQQEKNLSMQEIN